MQEVAKNGQRYARENLDPASIMCYHVRLLQEYTQLLHSKPKFNKGFELVEQPSESNNCKCQKYKVSRNVSKFSKLLYSLFNYFSQHYQYFIFICYIEIKSYFPSHLSQTFSKY